MELNKKRLRNAKRVAAHGSLRQRLFDRRGVQGGQEGAVVALVTQIAAVAGSEAPPEEWWPSEEEEAWRTQWRTPPPHAGQWNCAAEGYLLQDRVSDQVYGARKPDIPVALAEEAASEEQPFRGAGLCGSARANRDGLAKMAVLRTLLQLGAPVFVQLAMRPGGLVLSILLALLVAHRTFVPGAAPSTPTQRTSTQLTRPPHGASTTARAEGGGPERPPRSAPEEIEMEVEVLDGATASLGFFVVVGILIFICLQGEVNQGAIGNPTAAY
ncbi:unnamed protein product [Durusdinium trenchii]|uniref:Uncharacterized protein n=1 Tax=Durusdinium trenchii TaxID=1381693 RepID=A0ABP0HYP2_9DINO